ncbi:25036_t:CDS:1, partial [Dentiscutata erythropus]
YGVGMKNPLRQQHQQYNSAGVNNITVNSNEGIRVRENILDRRQLGDFDYGDYGES